MAQLEIKKILPSDFPPLLSEICDPPKKIFYKGTLPDWQKEKFLCIVGARKNTNYGKEVCEKLIRGMAGYPVTIVSGLALGIDAIAHRAALNAGLKTIAIPGSGLSEEVLYPSSHRALAEKIIAAGGCLMSEFEPDFKATVWSFPRRNRIMAGLSHAVLVIEAEQKSGTLITSRLATEYNRDVLTVPGSIFSPTAAGPHMLIRLGATPITSPDDLKDALGWKDEDTKTTDRDYSECSQPEQKILEALREPKNRDDLAAALHMPISELNATLSMLEIRGFIGEHLGEIHLL